jgi:uncharacterized repeat protein (TIGR04138 family)
MSPVEPEGDTFEETHLPAPSVPPDPSAAFGEQQVATAQQAAKTLDQVREAHAAVRRLIEVIEHDGRYPVDAYRFLQEGLDYAVRRIHGPDAGILKRRKSQPRDAKAELARHPHHVDGRQLCQGLLELAHERWGRLAGTVLQRWNIRRTDDFGEMVFVLVNHDFLQKTPNDRPEDFRDVASIDQLNADYRLLPPDSLEV